MNAARLRYLLLTAAPLLMAAAPADTTTVGGHTYRFPKAAFQGGMVETGRVGTVLLQLKWPGLEGLSLAEQLGVPQNDSLLILANSGALIDGDALPPEQLASAFRLEISIAVADLDQQAFPLRPATPAASDLPVPGGTLQRVVATPGPGGAPDVFVGPTLEAPSELIECSVPTPSFAAVCRQRFVDHNLLLKISYNRSLVPNWREIHAAITAFFDSAEERK